MIQIHFKETQFIHQKQVEEKEVEVKILKPEENDFQEATRKIQIKASGSNEGIIVSFVFLIIQQFQLIYLSFYNIQILLSSEQSFTHQIIVSFKNLTGYFMLKPLLEQFINGASSLVGSVGSLIHYTFYSVIFAKLFINLPKDIDNNIAYLMSFTMKCYIYILFAPIFTSLVDYQSFTLSNVPQVFISVFMGIIIILHDFNFSFAPTDFLSKKVNSIGFVQFFGNCIVMAFYQSVNAQPLIFSLQIVLSAIVANHVLNGIIFFDHKIEQFNFILILVNITINFCLLFMKVLGEQHIAIPFLILSSIIFSFRLGTEFYERKVQKILYMSIEKIETSEQLEQYVRANLMKKDDLNLENYYVSKLGIVFEGLKIQHKQGCKKKQCFCKRYESLEQQKKQDCKEKKRFLIKFIDKVFEKHLKKRRKDKNFDKNFLIIYCSFIIEILRCPIKSYVYLLQLEQDKDTQTLEQRVLSFLLQRKAKVQFEQYFKFDENNNFESSLSFCEQMDSFKEKYKRFLQKQRQIYIQIGQEHIDLNVFYNTCFNQINERNEIEQEIQSLFYVNRKSQKLQQYAFVFANIYDLKRQKFKKTLSSIYKKIYFQQIKAIQRSYKIFHKQTGIVFVSLLSPIGKIKRASKNFLNIFGYTYKELENQSINMLMPSVVGRCHDKILQFYVSKGVEHPNEIRDMQKLLLGKRKNQCLVPLNVYFQLSLLGTEEFGLNVLVQIVTNNSEYMYLEKVQQTSYQNRMNSSARLDQSQTIEQVEPICIFNSNYQNPNNINIHSRISEDQSIIKTFKEGKQDNNPQISSTNNTASEVKIFKSLGYTVSNVTPSAYYDLFLKFGIDNGNIFYLIDNNTNIYNFFDLFQILDKIKQLNLRKIFPIMFLDLEAGRQYKSIVILPLNDALIKPFQLKSDSYLTKNKQIVSLFKIVDEAQDTDYEIFEINFSVQVQIASNGLKFFYLEIFEYLRIERTLDKYSLINEVKQIICNLTKIKLPKSQKFSLINKTKDRVSSMLEKLKEKNAKKQNGITDPYSIQFVQNKVQVSQTSESDEDSDEEEEQNKQKFIYENEAEILKNLIGNNNFNTLNQNSNLTNFTEQQQRPQEMNSINLSPIRNEQLFEQDQIQEQFRIDDFLTDNSSNNKQKADIMMNNSYQNQRSINKQNTDQKITSSNENYLNVYQYYEEDKSSQNSEEKRQNSNYDKSISGRLSGYTKQNSKQKQINKNHRELMKRKSVQQKFFKSSPRNILKSSGVLKQTTAIENQLFNFTQNLSQTTNSQKLKLNKQSTIQNRKFSFQSDNASKISKYFGKYEIKENQKSEESFQDDEEKELKIQQNKQRRQLELNLDDSQDNLNMSVDISEMLNDNIQNTINDKASASSFRNEFNALKRKIINYIFDLSQYGLISSILVFGLISYLFFFGMTLFTYIIVNRSFSNQINSINQLSFSSRLIESHFFVSMIGQYLANYENDFSSQKLSEQRKNQLIDIQYKYFLSYEKQVVEIIGNNYQSEVIKNVFQTEIDFYRYNQQLQSSLKKNSLIYAILENIETFYDFMRKDGIQHKINELNILSNTQIFYDQYILVLDATIQNAEYSITYVQNLLQFGVILIETVSILSVSIVIPLYALIQKKRETILKLFSNFTRDKIESMVLQIDQFISHINMKQQSERIMSQHTQKFQQKSIDVMITVNQNNLFIRIQQQNIQWKKRASSKTSNLKKCRTYIIVSGLIILIAVSVYPCVNFIYTNNFLSDYKKLITQIVSLSKIKGLNLLKQSFLYTQVHQQLGVDQNIKEILFNYEQTIIDEADKLTGLYQIKKDFDEDQSANSDLKYLLIEPLKGDICSMISNKIFPIYEIDPDIDQVENCSQIWNNILKSGLLVANIELFTQQNSIHKIIDGNYTKQIFLQKLKEWESPNKMIDNFDKLVYWINQIYRTIEYQTKLQNEKQFEQIKQVQLILLLVAISMITLIYLVLWNIFIFHLYKEFIFTKQSLSLLHSSLIMENNYFLSHLKNQKLN